MDDFTKYHGYILRLYVVGIHLFGNSCRQQTVADLNDTWIFLTSLGHGGHHRQGSDRTKKVTVIAKSPNRQKSDRDRQ
jgi:hypothetical protein